MVELIINGSRREVEAATVVDVVRELGLAGRPVVAEVDGAVLTEEQWASTEVRTGMNIELVHFVGGG